MDESVDIRARLHGAGEVRSESRGMSDSILRIGWAARTASHGVGALSGAAGGFTRTVTSWRSAAVIGTLGYTGKALAGIGLGFDARMESNTVAFTQFLGSAQAARTELDYLYKTAAKTPFETEQIDTAARRMLAFGFNVKQTNSWLGTIGDTIAGMGGGAQEIDQLVTAIGQIKSKGRLQGDELMQLSELGVVNRQKLAKDLGITTLQLMSGNANVSGTRALRALQKQFDATFGGQSAKQARTFNGQLSTLRDNLSQVLGKGMHPVFDRLEREVFPAAGKATDDFNKALDRKDLSMADRINLGWSRARHDLSPVVKGIERDLKAAHLDDKLYDVIEWAAPKMADAAGQAAAKAVPAFVSSWLHAGVWGKVLTGAWLLKKIGLKNLLAAGRTAGGTFGLGFAEGAAPGEAAAAGGGAAAGRGRGAGGGIIAFATRYGLPVWLASEIAQHALHSHNADPLDFLHPESAGWDSKTERAHLRAMRHPRRESLVSYYRRHPRELDQAALQELGHHVSYGRDPDHRHYHIYIDGKEVAVRVLKHAEDAAARRNR